MTKKWDAIWTNGTIVTCENSYGLQKNGCIAVKNGKIAWMGAMHELQGDPKELASEHHDLLRRCLTPGLIDCHTHVVYAGNRAKDFELRLQGYTYEEIARQGGGIRSTVLATRNASEDELYEQSSKRIRAMIQAGVTTLEIKSGYGLDWQNELKMLRVVKRIEEKFPITIYKTFLGAHAIPPEYEGKNDAYVDVICNQMIPEIARAKLADAVDVFCEKIAFNIAQTERIFQTAKHFGLAIKCHAEQLSHLGGALLAANYQALSVDHLEYVTNEDIEKIAKTKTVAVLLPGAFYFLREKKPPPVDLLKHHQVPIALATDCNPGTSPLTSILLILNMACIQFLLTPEEALLGVTHNAAKALGMDKTHGTLAVGKVADFAIWDIDHPNELSYSIGQNRLHRLVRGGISQEI
jgi:imidazolonepropionase